MQTYHTLQDMRVVFLDGTVLDTADPASRDAFLKVPTPFLSICHFSPSAPCQMEWVLDDPCYLACLDQSARAKSAR